jgi:nickel/cobalt transporter (NiCoT) family protein
MASRTTTWTRRDWRQALGLLGIVAVLHLLAFGLLGLVVEPHHYSLDSTVLGVGLGLTAYTYGLRHAFDPDHIAAIDNTTRKLRADGGRPKAVGFWFAMGHSATVFVLACLVSLGVRTAGALVDGSSEAHRVLALVSTLASGGFLCLIGLLNLAALVGIWRVFRAMRAGTFDAAALEHHLGNRGLVARAISRANASLTRPWQMVLVGLLFGLGFDTATEVAVLVMAGSGAAAGVPWYAVLVLPLLFAAGMSLLDCLDGLFMSVAYDWAFLHPVRKVFYNLTVTGISVAVALVIGMVELVGVLHDDLGWRNPLTGAVSRIQLGDLGFVIVGGFVLVWAVALAWWRLGRIEERCPAPTDVS